MSKTHPQTRHSPPPQPGDRPKIFLHNNARRERVCSSERKYSEIFKFGQKWTRGSSARGERHHSRVFFRVCRSPSVTLAADPCDGHHDMIEITHHVLGTFRPQRGFGTPSYRALNGGRDAKHCSTNGTHSRAGPKHSYRCMQQQRQKLESKHQVGLESGLRAHMPFACHGTHTRLRTHHQRTEKRKEIKAQTRTHAWMTTHKTNGNKKKH